ncbi:MAG: motility protein A [Bacillota bacterium]|nr:motility protein A [Bacillota bacterium]
MDQTTIIGLVAGLILMLLALVLGGTASAFWDVKSIIITFGGTFAATLISLPTRQLLEAGRVMRKAFKVKDVHPLATISELVRFAERARREGLLALEDDADQLDDQFLKKGLQLVVDGSDPELVRDILQTEIAFIEDRHKAGAQLFDTLGALAPAFGMIGTIIGLIQMLRNLDDPSTIGSGMATALLTTFYGALAANLIFIPIAGKLRNRSQSEMLMKEVMLEGILSVQAGDNPRIVEEKLKVFLAPRLRRPVAKGAGAGAGAVQAGAAGAVGGSAVGTGGGAGSTSNGGAA